MDHGACIQPWTMDMVLVDIEGGSVKKKSSEYKMTIFLFIIMGQDANNDDYVDYSDDDDDNDLDLLISALCTHYSLFRALQ